MDDTACGISNFNYSSFRGVSPKINSKSSLQPANELFKKSYQVLPDQTLGEGGFGKVYAGTRLLDRAPVAIKHVPKIITKQWDYIAIGNINVKVPSEVYFLWHLSHIDGVIKLLDYFERDDSFLIIMERPPPKPRPRSSSSKSEFEPKPKPEPDLGPDQDRNRSIVNNLKDYLRLNGPVKPEIARSYFRQLVETLIQCHEAGVLHGDIKEENILIFDSDEDSSDPKSKSKLSEKLSSKIKLIDFGCSVVMKSNSEYNRFRDYNGIRDYAPPEWVRSRKYSGRAGTIWAAGILLYSMVCGVRPFLKDEQILRAASALTFPMHVTEDCRDLIRSCLKLRPADRLRNLEDILRHPWMQCDFQAAQIRQISSKREEVGGGDQLDPWRPSASDTLYDMQHPDPEQRHEGLLSLEDFPPL